MVGLLKPQEKNTLTGLPFAVALNACKTMAQFDLQVIETRSGNAMRWMKIDGIVQELYYLAVIMPS